jgi:hypothetical protein
MAEKFKERVRNTTQGPCVSVSLEYLCEDEDGKPLLPIPCEVDSCPLTLDQRIEASQKGGMLPWSEPHRWEAILHNIEAVLYAASDDWQGEPGSRTRIIGFLLHIHGPEDDASLE